jgi:uncharacterized protein (DUF885 family)
MLDAEWVQVHFGRSPAARAAAKTPASQSFHAILDAIADRVLALSPETATSLGVDVGPRAALRARLSDGSALGNARYATAIDMMMTQIHTTDRATLSPGDRLRWDTVHYALESAQMAKPFFYATAAQGFQGGTTPYAVTQQSGTIAGTPEFLDSQHPINSSADAEAYLSRVIPRIFRSSTSALGAAARVPRERVVVEV